MLKFGNIILKDGDKWLTTPLMPPISSNTIRVKTNDGNPPIKDEQTAYESATLVEGTDNIYDVYKSGTSFYRLLYNSTNVIEVLEANTTGVTDMEYMFNKCSSLTSVPLFDTSSVTNMAGMFASCSSLTSVPLFDTSSVTKMSWMFSGCSSLTTVPLFDTSSVTNMTRMFLNCSSLTSVPFFDTSSVSDFSGMFWKCSELTTVPLFDTSSAGIMPKMFEDCVSLTTVPLFNTSKVTDTSDMFWNCYNVESGALALYQQVSSQARPPAYHYYTFYNCGRDTTTGAAELAQIPSGWK